MARVSTGASRGRGGRSIYRARGGSPAKASPARVSMIMLIHSIWMTVTGVSTPKKGPSTDTSTAVQFMVS